MLSRKITRVSLGLPHICVYTPICTCKHTHTAHIERETQTHTDTKGETERWRGRNGGREKREREGGERENKTKHFLLQYYLCHLRAAFMVNLPETVP